MTQVLVTSDETCVGSASYFRAKNNSISNTYNHPLPFSFFLIEVFLASVTKISWILAARDYRWKWAVPCHDVSKNTHMHQYQYQLLLISRFTEMNTLLWPLQLWNSHDEIQSYSYAMDVLFYCFSNLRKTGHTVQCHALSMPLTCKVLHASSITSNQPHLFHRHQRHQRHHHHCSQRLTSLVMQSEKLKSI